MKRIAQLLFFSFGLSLVNTASAANDTACDPMATKYQSLAQRAQQQQQLNDALRWQNKAAEACQSYEILHQLGELNYSASNLDDAMEALRKAQDKAATRDQQADSIALYARALNDKGGLDVEALSLLKAAREMHSSPPPWTNELAMLLDQQIRDQPLTAEVVTRGMGSMVASDILTVKDIAANDKPFVSQIKVSQDYGINFKTNSTEVTAQSLKNLRVLADTLTGEQFTGKTIWLVGHSDARGDGGYNWELSEKRAQAAYNDLVSMQPSLANRLKVKGMGESKPLYSGNSEDVFRLNRRLEVTIE